MPPNMHWMDPNHPLNPYGKNFMGKNSGPPTRRAYIFVLLVSLIVFCSLLWRLFYG